MRWGTDGIYPSIYPRIHCGRPLRDPVSTRRERAATTTGSGDVVTRWDPLSPFSRIVGSHNFEWTCPRG